jgi:hypothetical protein
VLAFHASLSKYFKSIIFEDDDLDLKHMTNVFADIILMTKEQFISCKKNLFDECVVILDQFSDADFKNLKLSSCLSICTELSFFNLKLRNACLFPVSTEENEGFQEYYVLANSSIMWMFSSLQEKRIILIERHLGLESIIFDESSCAVIISFRDIISELKTIDLIESVLRNIVNDIAVLSSKYEFCYVINLIEEEFILSAEDDLCSAAFLNLQSRLITSLCIGFPLKLELQVCFNVQDLIDVIEKDLIRSIERKYSKNLKNIDASYHNSILNKGINAQELFLGQFPFINAYHAAIILEEMTLKDFLTSSFEDLSVKLHGIMSSETIGKVYMLKEKEFVQFSCFSTSKENESFEVMHSKAYERSPIRTPSKPSGHKIQKKITDYQRKPVQISKEPQNLVEKPRKGMLAKLMDHSRNEKSFFSATNSRKISA